MTANGDTATVGTGTDVGVQGAPPNMYGHTVLVHVPTGDSGVWKNAERVFARIPTVGEYVSIWRDTQKDWHRVVAVVHCSYDDVYGAYAAEIYTESKGLKEHEFHPPLSAR